MLNKQHYTLTKVKKGKS